jgi:hypothetical protein
MIDAGRLSEYRSYFARALKEHSQLTVRQETEPSVDVEDLFTDNKQLPTLLSSDWQIVYGRRGTGKTTLLSVLSKDIDAKADKASLMISMTQCLVELPRNTDPEVAGLVYFEKFIIEIGHLLFRIYQNRRAVKNQNRKITRLLNTFLLRHPIVESSILKIATFAHRGEEFGSLESQRSVVQEANTRARGRGFGLGLSIPRELSWKAVEARIEMTYEDRRKINRSREYVEERFIDFQDLRRTFKDLLGALEIDQLVIMIDEWSELDRSGSTIIQPIFAKYLRRAFFGDAQFCIKISAIRDESVFGIRDDRGHYIGLEVGDDIFDTVNLDAIYADRIINLEEFYTTLLFRRLLYCDPRLGIFSINEDLKRDPAPGFVDFLFNNDKRILPELVAASNGIPRQFISIFESIAQFHNYSIDPPWKMSVVRDRIISGTISYIDKNIEPDSIERQLLERIKAVGDGKKKMVLLPRRCHERIAKGIKNLYGRRLLHEPSQANIPFDIRNMYFVYLIDHGCFLDWNRTYRDHGDSDGPNLVDYQSLLTDIEGHIVNIDGLGLRKLCGNPDAGAGI